MGTTNVPTYSVAVIPRVVHKKCAPVLGDPFWIL